MKFDRIRYSGSLPVILASLCGLLFTCGLAAGIYSYERNMAQNEFDRRANEQVGVVVNGLDNTTEALRSINRLFATIDDVSREQFHAFTLGVLERNPYIKAISYQRLVNSDELAAFVAARRQDLTDFDVLDLSGGQRKPASGKQRYRVVDYIEPVRGNEAVIGIDVDSYTTGQNRAAARAVDLNQPSATETYTLLQDHSSSLAMGMLMATYRKGAVTGTAEQRRAALTGYTALVFRISDAVRNILEGSEAGRHGRFTIRIHEGTSAGGALLYSDAPAGTTCGGKWRPAVCPNAYEADIEVAGVPWHMVVSAPATPFFSVHSGSALVLLFGLTLTLLSAVYLNTQAARTRRIEKLVEERTAELMRANLMLADDISSRKEAEAALQHSRESLRKLAANQEKAIENERKRIAREIHDELGQSLLALRIDAALLHQRARPNSRFHTRTAAALKQIDTTIRAVRQIINDLRPSVLDLGLPAAIEWQVTEFRRRSGILCNLAMDSDELTLDDQTSTALFRILQESLSNIIRHAQACRVWVAFYRQEDSLILRIKDDGIGMIAPGDAKNESFGLVGIRERITALGGTISIESSPGDGVSIIVSIPYLHANIAA